jgi:hypothetical protein
MHGPAIQINPHFLYNTLDMINWMAIAEGARGVSKAVSTLGQFFRTVLDGINLVISHPGRKTLTRKTSRFRRCACPTTCALRGAFRKA